MYNSLVNISIVVLICSNVSIATENTNQVSPPIQETCNLHFDNFNNPQFSRLTKLQLSFLKTDYYTYLERFQALLVPNTPLPEDLKHFFVKDVPGTTEEEMLKAIQILYEDELNPSLVLCGTTSDKG